MAKIHFSQSQIDLMQNADIILQKQQILQNIEKVLWKIAEEIKEDKRFAKLNFPEGMDYKSGKLSRGENLEGLPWRILDFPRLFSNEQITAFRFLFWWGKTFEFSFITDDKSQIDLFKENLNDFSDKEFFIYNGNEPLKMSESQQENMFVKIDRNLSTKQFNDALRISVFLSLDKWQIVPEKGKRFFSDVAKVCFEK